MSNELITAIILTYNKQDYTRLCLEGLLRTAYRPLEVILVDNGSTEELSPMLDSIANRARKADVDLRVIRNDTNRGAPAGRNQAISAARGDSLLFIDNDAVPFNPQWLGHMVERLSTLPQAGAVSARLLYPFSPHLVQFAGCGISAAGRVLYIGRGAQQDDPSFTGDREVQCLISACLLMPRALARDAGGFDEAFSPVQYEDLDLCYKIRERGYRCYVAGGAEVYHFENVTTDGSTDINFRYVTIRNGLLFKERWKSRFQAEDGPAEDETAWLKLPHRSLDEMGPDWSPWEN
ncbi:MAG TPA: glycosyltransferase family 2 protein, partial [Armatimonadota bacterium]|nr:glycosyltransferase family 2 protein [Armatimonadota bacterium]